MKATKKVKTVRLDIQARILNCTTEINRKAG